MRNFIALIFMDYLSPHAFEVASKFRAMGKVVIGGGKFASTFLMKLNPTLIRFALAKLQKVWAQMVNDLLNSRYKKK